MPRHLAPVPLPAVLLCLGLSLGAGRAAAWSNHTLGAQVALAGLPAIAQAAPVTVEPIEAFLKAEAPALEKLLAAEEAWARALVPAYPPRPDALAFRAGVPDEAPAALRQRFLAAVRANPQVHLALYLQRMPGAPDDPRPPLNWSKVTLLRFAGPQIAARYVALQPGDSVPPIDVVASACDEPDYGLDVGLWTDSGQPHAAAYALGKQPFGGNAYEYASQAPLHMGFFHEAAIVNRAAPFLGRTLPEARVHLWQSLAAHALRSGHAYWGWRFAGWALHYAQDLTQPYHARVLPGVATWRMLAINAADLMGWHGPKNDAVTLVGNRHTVVENLQYRLMRDALERGDMAEPLLVALRGRPEAEPAQDWDDRTLRDRLTQESADAADALDAALAAALPARYVSDATVTVSSDEAQDLPAVLAAAPAEARARLRQVVAERLARFGVHTRAFVRDLIGRARVK